VEVDSQTFVFEINSGIGDVEEVFKSCEKRGAGVEIIQ
jgi:hypothetical protein